MFYIFFGKIFRVFQPKVKIILQDHGEQGGDGCEVSVLCYPVEEHDGDEGGEDFEPMKTFGKFNEYPNNGQCQDASTDDGVAEFQRFKVEFEDVYFRPKSVDPLRLVLIRH